MKLLAILLLVACGDGAVPPSSREIVPFPTQIEVLSWNVDRPRRGEDPADAWELRGPKVSQAVSSIDPDILILQDIREDSQRATLEEALPEHLFAFDDASGTAVGWRAAYGEPARVDVRDQYYYLSGMVAVTVQDVEIASAYLTVRCGPGFAESMESGVRAFPDSGRALVGGVVEQLAVPEAEWPIGEDCPSAAYDLATETLRDVSAASDGPNGWIFAGPGWIVRSFESNVVDGSRSPLVRFQLQSGDEISSM